MPSALTAYPKTEGTATTNGFHFFQFRCTYSSSGSLSSFALMSEDNGPSRRSRMLIRTNWEPLSAKCSPRVSNLFVLERTNVAHSIQLTIFSALLRLSCSSVQFRACLLFSTVAPLRVIITFKEVGRTTDLFFQRPTCKFNLLPTRSSTPAQRSPT